MTEGEKRLPGVPRKHRSFYERGAFFIILTALIIILFTGGIAYGVQGLVGGGPVDIGGFADGATQFRIEARQWSYEPAIIKVNPGDKVRFVVISTDIEHGFAINELGLNLTTPPEEVVIHEVVIPQDIAEGIYTMY